VSDDITMAVKVLALRNDTVAEAQDGRIRKGTHSGDPLGGDGPR
jgi:hypothetical protein